MVNAIPADLKDERIEPDVLQYTNYRVYLKDYYEFKKSTSPGFSLRFFASKAGLSSHAHLKLIIDGKRNITKRTVTKMVIGLGLNSQRANYFENLVFFNQVENEKEKKLYYDNLLKVSPVSKLRKLEDSQFRIFREWYHAVVREMVTLKEFQGAPEWISRRILGDVSPKQVGESLKLLMELGLIKRTANGYKQKDALVSTDDEVSNMLVKAFHQNMIDLGKNALESLSGADRDVSSVTFGIRRKDFDKMKHQIQLMRKELLNFSAKAGEADEIVQVNIQMFPLTKGN